MPLRRIHLFASIAVTAFVIVLHVLSYFQTSPTHLLQLAVGLSLAALAPMLIEIFRGRRRETNSIGVRENSGLRSWIDPRAG